MLRSLAWIVAIGLVSAVPLHAQPPAASPVGRTLTLDVVGPRSSASVASWLATRLSSLAACQGEEDELDVVVALAIGPDGTLLSVEPGENPSASTAAASCVVHAMRSWRTTTRAASVTTASWRVRLAARHPPPGVTCYCFSWVHGRDFGTSCSTTLVGCEEEAETSMRDHTECRASTGTAPRCPDEAVIGGARMERP